MEKIVNDIVEILKKLANKSKKIYLLARSIDKLNLLKKESYL